jgi:CHAT domain-containing protein
LASPHTQGVSRVLGFYGLEALFQSERLGASLEMLSHELAMRLWQEITPKLVELGISKLVLMPDSLLAALPYVAALQLDQESLLLQPYLLAVAPSSRVWSLCQKRALDMTPGKKWLLVSGDESAGIGLVWPLYLQLRQSLGPDGEILWESALTKETFAEATSSANIIQFHLHGRFDQDVPGRSAFGLSDGKMLTMDELSQSLSLENTRLVVLSACESGEPASEPIPNAIGFPSAFLRMGVPAVLAAPWKVSELSTVLLLSHFYVQLAQNYSIAKALQMAQTWLKNLTGTETIEILQTWAEDCKSIVSVIPPSKRVSLSIARQQLIAILEELQDENNFLNSLLENLAQLPDAEVEPFVLGQLQLSSGGRENWLREIWSTLRDKIELGEEPQGVEWVKETLSRKLQYPWHSVYHWGGLEANGAVF